MTPLKRTVLIVLVVLTLTGFSDGLATWYGLSYLGLHELNPAFASTINSNPWTALLLWPFTFWGVLFVGLLLWAWFVKDMPARRVVAVYLVVAIPVLAWYAWGVWFASVRNVMCA